MLELCNQPRNETIDVIEQIPSQEKKAQDNRPNYSQLLARSFLHGCWADFFVATARSATKHNIVSSGKSLHFRRCYLNYSSFSC